MVDAKTFAKRQNYCIDFVKGIACICVVFMHCEFPGQLGIYVQCVTRFSVPFFFMVAGYFCFYEGTVKKGSAGKILHLSIITLCAAAFYLLIAILRAVIGMNPISVSPGDLLHFLVFNQPVVIAEQLWFLFALLYDYGLYMIVERFRLYKAAYRAIPLLLLLYICLAQGAHIFNICVPNMVYRNFLLEGFPLFMLGHWIHRNKERLLFPKKILLAVIAVFTLLCIGERHLLGRDFGINICTFPQVIAIFLFCINYPLSHKGSALQILGTYCSSLVYILHPFVWHALEFVYRRLSLSQNLPALYLLPVLVVIITIALAAICYQVTFIVKKKYLGYAGSR